MADVTWSGQSSGGRLYVQSGSFTSTIKTSHAQANTGVSYDSVDTYYCGSSDLFRSSGQFTSVMKDSEDVSSIDGGIRGISFDGDDTPWISDGGDKMYLQSGNFTSTLKTSQSHPNSQPGGISSNTDQDTPNCGFYPDTLYIHSGQFTSTVKSNLSVGGDPYGISWDGSDTLWAKRSGASFLKLQSGAITSTVKDSLNISAVESTAAGIESSDFGARTGVFLGNVFAEELPASFAMPAPTIDLISNIIVTPPALGLGIQPEDTAHIDSNHPRPYAIAMNISAPDPVVDFGQEIPVSGLSMSMNLFAPTINIITQTIVYPSTLTISAVAEVALGTPDYAWVDASLPLMTLNARIYNGFIGTTSLPMLTLSANCVVGFLTYTSQTLPMLTLNARMAPKVSLSLPMLTLSATGTTGSGGTLTKVLPLLTLSASGQATNKITFAKSLPMFTLDINMVLGGFHTFASSLPMLTLSAEGASGSSPGFVTADLPLVTLDASGYSDGNGTLTKALPMLTLDAFGTSHIARII